MLSHVCPMTTNDDVGGEEGKEKKKRKEDIPFVSF